MREIHCDVVDAFKFSNPSSSFTTAEQGDVIHSHFSLETVQKWYMQWLLDAAKQSIAKQALVGQTGASRPSAASNSGHGGVLVNYFLLSV